MNVAISLLALARPSGDLVAGLVIGAALGFLAGPLVRHLLAVREWAAASHEAQLTDELVERLRVPGPEHDDRANPEEDGASADPRDRDRVGWPTSR